MELKTRKSKRAVMGAGMIAMDIARLRLKDREWRHKHNALRWEHRSLRAAYNDLQHYCRVIDARIAKMEAERDVEYKADRRVHVDIGGRVGPADRHDPATVRD